MEVRHYRASNTIWSPLSTHASMRVVITGRVLVQKKLDGTCDGVFDCVVHSPSNREMINYCI